MKKVSKKPHNKPRKTPSDQERDLKRVESALEKYYPKYTWEDRAMWLQTPKEWLFDMSPLMIIATQSVEPLLKWLEEHH